MENTETIERTPEPEESGPPEVRHLNEVHVVGRVSAAPEVRPLSGGELVVWRMAVERPRPPDTPRRSDWIGCTASEQTPRSIARDLRVGDVAEIHGVLRRRFWRSRNGPMTPLEVEVRGVVPLVRAARRTPASPGP
jgi:single-strand DNA-binding protein